MNDHDDGEYQLIEMIWRASEKWSTVFDEEKGEPNGELNLMTVIERCS